MSQADPFAAITFATGTGALDRAAHLRDQSADLMRAAGARLLPLCQGKVLIALDAAGPRLGWVPAVGAALDGAADGPVFLGLSDGTACFAVEVPERSADTAAGRVGAEAKFIDLRSVAGQLHADEAVVAATAKAILGWHLTHPFCARCGARTGVDHGGWRRRCGACGALHFPRTDPVVIMLVLRGDRALVGRQSGWPAGMYSLLAGFMEPGETLADAVRRETAEEAGVTVGRVRYLACQPWPFPSNLMLGCVAEGLSEAITLDPAELEAALWVDRAEMAQILAGAHPVIAAPRGDAIARSLLGAWVAGDITGI